MFDPNGVPDKVRYPMLNVKTTKEKLIQTHDVGHECLGNVDIYEPME